MIYFLLALTLGTIVLALLTMHDNARLRAQLAELEAVDPSEDKTGAAAILDDRSYEIGHRDGENSANADWGMALDEILPVGVNGWSLREVEQYILKMQGEHDG